ncbi:MAG: repeat domain protein [Labilithrix sp.]|nr:repeat domain protein [Labilithrix sp.]
MRRSRFLLFVSPLVGLLATLPFAGCASESFVGSIEASDVDAEATDASDAGTVTETSDAASDVVDATAPFDAAPIPVQCSGPSCVIALSAGAEHYCATLHDQSVRCWGNTNALPLPAEGEAEAEPGKPVPLLGVGPVVDLAAAGNGGTCVVSASGAVSCWSDWQRTPTTVPDIPAARRVFVGPDGATRCILDASSELVCWGDSWSLGQGLRRIDGAKPRDVRFGLDVGLVALADGRLLTWGYGPQLAHQYAGGDPSQVFGLIDVEVLAVGDGHVCARTKAGEISCWGRGGKGQLGSGLWRDEVTPTPVALPASIALVDLSTTSLHTCGRATTGDVYCWGGLNARGELGLAAKQGVYAPTRVPLPAGPAVANVVVGNTSSCALRSDGSVLCWGDNTRGQLGRGGRDERRHPEPQVVVFP